MLPHRPTLPSEFIFTLIDCLRPSHGAAAVSI